MARGRAAALAAVQPQQRLLLAMAEACTAPCSCDNWHLRVMAHLMLHWYTTGGSSWTTVQWPADD